MFDSYTLAFSSIMFRLILSEFKLPLKVLRTQLQEIKEVYQRFMAFPNVIELSLNFLSYYDS